MSGSKAHHLAAAQSRRERWSKEYVFLDEWDVDARRDAVFEALADPRTYPEWWKPVYIEVEGDESPART